ncbi:unnamed protein product [Adineta ricciae]|uniref:MD-2-related lipid-recognition domain-containing protein n=1 Tax=Adineta ricciae TaxID=249248 RepID=A0A815R4C8_ADIRI|nr:unnamed protein product [Adineta ricciae]
MLSTYSLVFVLFVALVIVDGQTFSNCGGASDQIKLKGLAISPYPIKVPGPATFTLDVDVSENIVNPLQTKYDLVATALGFPVKIKCENCVGSCTYDDWCKACPTCPCPVNAGNQKMVIAMNFTSSIPIGSKATVKAQIDFLSPTGQTGCVLMPKIEVRK